VILSVTLNPSVDRALFIERLAPGDTNRVLRTETDAGGKGINVARVAAELGAETLCLGLLGGPTGRFIRHVLDAEGVGHDFTRIEGETRLNISVETADGSAPTTFNELGPSISPKEYQSVQNSITERAASARFVSMGGSLPPGIPADAFASIAKMTAGKAIVDADGESMRLALGERPFLVKPNRHEAERLLGTTIASRDDAMGAAEQLRARGAIIAIISLGGEGAVMATSEGNFSARPPRVDVVSTIGSGDSLIGGFLYALERGMQPDDCLRWGVAAGAATATTSGAEICRKPLVEELLGQVVVERLR
jgi:1-phosphofructokinase